MYHWFKHIQDPISSYTHFLGACFGGVATLIFLISCLWLQRPLLILFSTCVFGLSMVALYSASCYYHTLSWENPKHTLFRKLDHSMIFVLIAGTYTPICLYYLIKPASWIFTLIIWFIALSGIVIKIFWLNAPRLLYTLLYVAMGWAVVFYWPAFAAIPLPCLSLIAAGGLAYTIGAVLYIIKKPNLSKLWGFHELFHIFILLGSFFHFMAIYLFIVLV